MQLVKTHLHPTGKLVLPKYWTTDHTAFGIYLNRDLKIYFKYMGSYNKIGEGEMFVVFKDSKKVFEFVGTLQEVKEFGNNYLEELEAEEL